MALLLASFSSNVLNDKEEDDDENKIGEAINRIQQFFILFYPRKKTNDQVCSIIYLLFSFFLFFFSQFRLNKN